MTDMESPAATAPTEQSDAAAGEQRAHGHSRKEVWVVFVALFLLTVLEVAAAKAPGVGKTAVAVLLIGMAIAKASLVALFFMHLKYETRVLRWSIAGPLSVPAIYALVLVAEAAWRMLP